MSNYKKIKWTPERFTQARAMKFRWMYEDLDPDRFKSEMRMVWHDFMDDNSAENHLEAWIYTHDIDLFYEWVR